MAFRAKCRITGVHDMLSVTSKTSMVETKQVVLQPVYGQGEDDANTQWSKWTPSGEIRLSITNPDIFPELVIGRTFFVTFEAVSE